jgi:UDP-3-O-acyl-N-acetylglucosamine deacetylase
VLVVHEITRIGTDEAWVEARPTAGMGMSVNFRLDYGPASPIGRQALSLPITPDSFRRELAPARTFMLKAEAERMQAQGLGMRTTCRDLLVYGEEGPLDNTLRFSDECVRHKALDLVGDLTLAGCDIVGHIVAYRSGHRLNAELVRAMLNQGTARGDLKRTA